MVIKIGNTYKFSELEEYLKQSIGKCLIVTNLDVDQKAFMHTFGGNFCGDWLSGDGILFYDDNEQHSANETDTFLLHGILSLND